MQLKKQKLFFIKLDSSNLVEYIADPDRYLLISSSECLNKTFFFNIHFFSPKSRQIAVALRIVIFCPCYWIRHLIRPHDWHAEKKCNNSIFAQKCQHSVISI